METPIADPEDQLFEERKRALSNIAGHKLHNIKLKGKKTIEKEITELMNAAFALGYLKGQTDTRRQGNVQTNSDSGSQESQRLEGQNTELVYDEKTT